MKKIRVNGIEENEYLELQDNGEYFTVQIGEESGFGGSEWAIRIKKEDFIALLKLLEIKIL